MFLDDVRFGELVKHFPDMSQRGLCAYSAKKDHIAVSIDGLPWVPLPLPPLTRS
ncbi:hypothetical protein LWC34_47665 [Kibdelosporangium philippinense]|uniref:Uncharacterized protein n=1 Tax=Kibdelosporangium philippinense TaxID=211113 RepID=A0ABS8ZS76_9PSEU|nr:hypothetical protein [Kibdelosporangium philippinense]MCE7010434.1 hypothetical protein [Kibdelosporangium philippinense]